ncbi:hypothetical protein TNCV_3520791 [Trichonephila clavipes]|nr:hypothetical protein TNCV_3520791 [Trichonephila clavipes]
MFYQQDNTRLHTDRISQQFARSTDESLAAILPRSITNRIRLERDFMLLPCPVTAVFRKRIVAKCWQGMESHSHRHRREPLSVLSSTLYQDVELRESSPHWWSY